MGGPDPTAAIARLLPQLTPVAVLLTDDPADAVRLLGAALARPVPWTPPPPRGRLGHAAVHRPRWAADQVIGSLDPAVPADDDARWPRRCAALPAPTRVAAVLGTDPAAERRCRRRWPAGTRPARAGPGTGSRALFAVPGSAPEPAAPPAAARAARPARRGPAAARGRAADDRRRGGHRPARPRRRRLQLAAAALPSLVLAVVVPLLPRGGPVPTPDPTADQPRSSPGDRRVPGRRRGVPPRAARARLAAGRRDGPPGGWSTPRTCPAGAGRCSPPAGPRPAGGRRLVHRPRGSPRRRHAPGVGPDRPPTRPSRSRLTDPATGTLVVVGAPDDQFAVSERPEVSGDGTVQRVFVRPDTSAGVAELQLATGARCRGQRRPARGGAGPAARPSRSARPSSRPDPARPARRSTGCARRRSRRSGDGAVGPQLASVLGQLGRPAADADVTVLWAGDLPGPNDRPARLTVLALPQPPGPSSSPRPTATPRTRAGGRAARGACTGRAAGRRAAGPAGRRAAVRHQRPAASTGRSPGSWSSLARARPRPRCSCWTPPVRCSVSARCATGSPSSAPPATSPGWLVRRRPAARWSVQDTDLSG